MHTKCSVGQATIPKHLSYRGCSSVCSNHGSRGTAYLFPLALLAPRVSLLPVTGSGRTCDGKNCGWRSPTHVCPTGTTITLPAATRRVNREKQYPSCQSFYHYSFSLASLQSGSISIGKLRGYISRRDAGTQSLERVSSRFSQHLRVSASLREMVLMVTGGLARPVAGMI